jgi:hypothetical protein
MCRTIGSCGCLSAPDVAVDEDGAAAAAAGAVGVDGCDCGCGVDGDGDVGVEEANSRFVYDDRV